MVESDQIVQLKDEFYKDCFGRLVFVMFCMLTAIVFLIIVSFYLYKEKPEPTVFQVDNEWRVKPPVPLDQPYLSTPDLLQWVSDVLPRVLVYDFINYNSQLQAASQYFTADGWQIFLNQLNIYANYNNVQTNKLFINGTPAGAPYILNQGLLGGRYAWWIQMPINLNYAGYNPPANRTLTLQVLVSRVSTLNNLNGVGIDNVIVAKGS